MRPVVTRTLYRWSEGMLCPVGTVSDAHLRAWEYEPVPSERWTAERGQRVGLWRTRRPDLAPPELWIGEGESELRA